MTFYQFLAFIQEHISWVPTCQLISRTFSGTSIINLYFFVINDPYLAIIKFNPFICLRAINLWNTLTSGKRPIVSIMHSTSVMNYYSSELITVVFKFILINTPILTFWRLLKNFGAHMCFTVQCFISNVKICLISLIFFFLLNNFCLIFAVIYLTIFNMQNLGIWNPIGQFRMLHSLKIHFETLEMN